MISYRFFKTKSCAQSSAHIWPNNIHMCHRINQFKLKRLQAVKIRDSRMESHHGI
ncbi:hypothetical protein CY34DRAFT_800224 [Suillus luteus UH-Slu-Lm8-n1]|uniref:Uncharacterized protein n=1 Tax=Suillus luteus UH-Slu-Lm8-n1 TaxID=930992 RepID=A0A0D0A942_9AGAM|nr:hypothetical protein CY34DRAFT_800224 [Suillus luteus UH-Slu-Lm8-n1]